MNFNISAKLKLLTLNQAFITLPNGRRCRSKAYAKFAQSLSIALMTKQREFKDFDDTFDPKRHELHARIVFWTPDLYAKAGTISKNSMDCGNVEKCLLDNVLVLNIDDSAITKLEVSKLHGPEYCFELDLNIVTR